MNDPIDVGVLCSGCGACEQRCPQKCIRLNPDEEGFLRPCIDRLRCVNCGVCRESCPAITTPRKRNPIKAFAGWHNEANVRDESSTAGVFTALAQGAFENGGVVCGASFDSKGQVRHSCVENSSRLNELIGSKYVQSDIRPALSEILSFVKERRQMLFVGTPCQVACVNAVVPDEFRQYLIAVELCCHGVPSPLVWRRYLREHNVDVRDVERMSFRSKANGWRNYSLCIETKDGVGDIIEGKETNNYMRGFLKNLYCRPSCANCRFRQFATGSDIAIGDFWGLNRFYPEKDDDRGCNQILILSEKGNTFFERYVRKSFDAFPITIGEAFCANLNFLIATPFHCNRDKFWKLIRNGETIDGAVRKCLDGSRKLSYRILNRICKILRGPR